MPLLRLRKAEGQLNGGKTQAVVHNWKGAVAVRASGAVQLTFVDANSMSEEVLVESTTCNVAFEKSGSSDSSQVRICVPSKL